MKKKSFTAGGKTYRNESQLTMLRIHFFENIFLDCFGRKVILVDERYPCFDEFDRMHEDRYFHHYYIKTNDGYAHVRTADDQDEIVVNGPISEEALIWHLGTWNQKLLVAAGLMKKS